MTEVPFVGFSVGIIRDKWKTICQVWRRFYSNWKCTAHKGQLSKCDEKMVLILFLCWYLSRPIRMGLNSARIFKVSFTESFGSVIHHKTGKWKVTHKNSGGFCDQIVVTFTRNIGLSSNYLFPMWESHETYQNEFINIQKWTRITFKYDNLIK